jgi:hypothetical protein
MIRARVPATADPAGGPVALTAVSGTAGWLGDRSNWRLVTTPAPMPGANPDVVKVELVDRPHFGLVDDAAAFAGDKTVAVWLPDRRLALTWRAFHSKDPPLVLQAAVEGGTQRLPAAGHRRMVVDASSGINLTLTTPMGASLSVRSVQYHDGDATIGSPITAAPFTLAWRPTTPGPHPVFAVWQAADGSTGTTSVGLVVVRSP